ncbi:FUSC family protein (plasmid) [Burkholderia sp. SFA1]|uniref:FUSC family protein n=1 Tax=unclassified Caballeronia TaxID=2646786 RepID=UPI001F32EA41|nr:MULTISPECIES: FUSC family protein [unclassified Caballeronia]MCE4546531.1 FUSC family protein [Caballeronia sp. PC1]MCE4572996.1 FUSC family protein [Caballeronia sp. CLC5]BBQ01624.1 FUSC family protein [Burkholderia sp. SFA1]
MSADAPQQFRLTSEIKVWPLSRALAALSPFVVLALVTGNALWMKASLLAISTVIAEDRLALRPVGVAAHGLAIIAGTYLLLLAELVPAFFIIACMLLAAGVILLASRGERLRTIGTWTFVPVLILANELHGGRTVEALLRATPAYLPYLLVALMPGVISAYLRSRGKPAARWSNLDDFGARTPLGEDLAAMLASVGIAGVMVVYWRMENAQWVIWGAASIVTGAVDTARAKLQNRAIGVMAGVPIGIVLGRYLLPHSGMAVTLATLAGFLTLVAFQRYVVGYFFRCLFVALAIMLANQSVAEAFERLTHVLAGGVIGIACVLGMHAVVGRVGR